MATISKMKVQLARQYDVKIDKVITKPIDIVEFINSVEHYDLSLNEQVVVIALNTKNEVIAYSDIYIGATNMCNVNVSDIFKFLCATPATKFIVVHNHPSGNSTPSKMDLAFTERLETASNLMGIPLIDHIVIGDNEYTSIFEYRMNKH